MARATMENLILELRSMCDAGTADYAVAGITYWTDDQLQDVLDRRRIDVIEDRLVYTPENFCGTVVVTRYYSHYGNYEQTDGGTALFVVRDQNHDVVGTASYTPDYTRGQVVYAQDTGGSALYITGRSYDLNNAAADVWDRKAAQAVSASYSWSSDNMRVDKSAARREAQEMARYYRGLRGAVFGTMERSDT